jgi:hypothetical protein
MHNERKSGLSGLPNGDVGRFGDSSIIRIITVNRVVAVVRVRVRTARVIGANRVIKVADEEVRVVRLIRVITGAGWRRY